MNTRGLKFAVLARRLKTSAPYRSYQSRVCAVESEPAQGYRCSHHDRESLSMAASTLSRSAGVLEGENFPFEVPEWASGI